MADPDSLAWMDKIRQKVAELFKNDRKTAMRVLNYLEEQLHKDDGRLGPAWRTLISALSSDEVFRDYAQNLAEETKRGENDGVGWQLDRVADKIVARIKLAALELSYSVYRNIVRWWNGEITGERCLKNLIDDAATVLGGVGGALYGVFIGAPFGPAGAVVGGVIGGVFGSVAMKKLTERLTSSFFGIPKEEALENAYNFLGVNMRASNHEINQAYHKLCLKHHPDKPGGSKEEFFVLQLNMAVIKAARGEF